MLSFHCCRNPPPLNTNGDIEKSQSQSEITIEGDFDQFDFLHRRLIRSNSSRLWCAPSCVSLLFHIHRPQVLVEADLITFLNGALEFADECVEAQHGSLANLLEIIASHLYSLRKVTLLWDLFEGTSSPPLSVAMLRLSQPPRQNLAPALPSVRALRARSQFGRSGKQKVSHVGGESLMQKLFGINVSAAIIGFETRVRVSNEPLVVGCPRSFLRTLPPPVRCGSAWNVDFLLHEIVIRFWYLQRVPVNINAADQSAVRLLVIIVHTCLEGEGHAALGVQ